MRSEFLPGQRWVSESEPELGLGSIVRVTDRTVTTAFPASAQQREYAVRSAPLRRVRFHAGDVIQPREGAVLLVDAVADRGGLFFYRAGTRELCETELSDAITFSKPEERLFAGQVDPPSAFELRVAALERQYVARKSRVRGFAGGRIDLIPHQLYIASEVAGRLAPRVLLADEVGLGKTIEACLILHRLIVTGRAQRVLILTPDSLVHQWFVELLRRFNLWFSIFDEERCQAIEAAGAVENPFLDEQLVLASINLFAHNSSRTDQAVRAGWDVLVVDEAHHLRWAEHAVSPEYAAVESLGSRTPALLLLTATPEQLGLDSHFARLRLLDPDRFFDLREFIKETEQYREVARQAESVTDPQVLSVLLDEHGTGRVIFRNTRAAISGFPGRRARLTVLDPEETAGESDVMADWLAKLLLSLEPAKVLLICRTQARVAALEIALRERLKNARVAVFHEGLSLVQRDRNAAWFAEPDGARILLCSEIGSEGRNFQFAHHLVLFDLPLDPELLEQRIGRLDRIGQTHTIQIHVPYVRGSALEALALWHHEGLGAIEKNLNGGRELFEEFGARVYALAQNHRDDEASRAALRRLIDDSRAAGDVIAMRLHEGRDRLLELSSFRPAAAARLIEEIQHQDRDRSLDDFMMAVFDEFALNVEEIAPRTYKLGSAGVLADSFPGLPVDGFTMTTDRKRALVREDLQFLTWDHPIVTGAFDLVLGAEKGNSSLAHWEDRTTSGLYLESIYVLECVAPPDLHIDRFLPPTPLRVFVDRSGKDVSSIRPPRPAPSGAHALMDNPEVRQVRIPAMLEQTQKIAARQVPGIIQKARDEMNAQLDHEIARVKDLQKVNPSVRAEEIDLLVSQKQSLDEHLRNARLRLDAIRLIHRGRA